MNDLQDRIAALTDADFATLKAWVVTTETDRRATRPAVEAAQAEVVTDLQERGKLGKPATSTVDETGKITRRAKWQDPGTIHEKMYRPGDIVEHDGQLWRSTHPFLNPWQPGAAGVDERIWAEYTEPAEQPAPGSDTPAPAEPATETVPDFVQPTGAHDAYPKGAKVRFEGAVYESLIPDNSFSPTAYPDGWKKL